LEQTPTSCSARLRRARTSLGGGTSPLVPIARPKRLQPSPSGRGWTRSGAPENHIPLHWGEGGRASDRVRGGFCTACLQPGIRAIRQQPLFPLPWGEGAGGTTAGEGCFVPPAFSPAFFALPLLNLKSAIPNPTVNTTRGRKRDVAGSSKEHLANLCSCR
jgi:hypothetical protein